MNKTIALIAGVALGAIGTAYGLYSLNNRGDWPKDWPKELESLRAQARTLVGPEEEFQHFAIGFTKREELEAAWPHFLKVKTKGAPVILVRAPNFFLGDVKAGVVIHCPPERVAGEPRVPPVTDPAFDVRTRWQHTNYIELVVDGEVVDLNRIPLPADTPIVDERFKE